MGDVAIRIDGVSKDFRLPDEKLSSVKGHIVHPFKQRNYKVQHALKDINVEIKKGEFFGIVGRNGSGKSTLLKILAGIYQPTAGKVHTVGKLVPFIELGVGFNPELTGKDNVYLNGALLGFDQKEINAQYDDIVEFAELEQFMDQKLKNYSSGMQVRLAFSMAVRAKADILLIDEVLAVGDADFQRKCFEYFKKLKKEHTTVVFVSHNMDAVREYCDRAMLIEENRVVSIGATTKISEKYLQLFMNESNTSDKRKQDSHRWGDKALIFSAVHAEVASDYIRIVQALKASENIERPIVGFRIRDAAGKEITGTNTIIEQCRMPDFAKGQHKTVEWTFANILSDGEYTIDPAVLHADGITVSDWWNDAAKFQIKKNHHVPYIIDPGFKVTVK